MMLELKNLKKTSKKTRYKPIQKIGNDYDDSPSKGGFNLRSCIMPVGIIVLLAGAFLGASYAGWIPGLEMNDEMDYKKF